MDNKKNKRLCECGCGKQTTIIKKTVKSLSKVKGEYNRFLPYHHLKILEKSEEHKKKIGLSNFKQGKILRKGYIYLYVKDHPNAVKYGPTKYVSEHRLIMEKHIGRYLKPTEVIHHIDGNIKNNVISNFILFPNQSAHAKFHYTFNNIRNKNKLKGGRYNGKKNNIKN